MKTKKERRPYDTDLTDEQWAILEPLIPPQGPYGRRREVDMRRVINAILYVLKTGCQWGMLPRDFPPKSTVYDSFREWQGSGGIWEKTHDVLREKLRLEEARNREASGGCLDSQSVRTTEKGGSGLVTTLARR